MKIFPRPVSPKSALSDIINYLSGPLPHKWPLLGLSMALTFVIIWAFMLDTRLPPVQPQIIYVKNWRADRKDSTIIEEQKSDLAQYEAALEREQKKFQTVADRFGVEWRQEAARDKARRVKVIAEINRRLDEKIAKAKAREAAEAGQAASTAAGQASGTAATP